MILVIGGAYQGKKEFAMRQFGIEAEKIADGAAADVMGTLSEHAAVCDYQLRIRRQIEAGLDPEEEFRRLIAGNRKICIIADEIGSGLIPMERAERDYREAAGRTLCLAAKEADEVWRVVCGIGQRIK